uniref:Uncharacterized protein n=1 Tax=Ananas comosus var. bracteatus TaxID=296719 RepID=A0A6V7QR00_ANACO
MGSRLGRRVIHFANMPIKLLLPSPPFDSIREIALKTIPSATKIEIRRHPLSISPDVFPIRIVQEERERIAARARSSRPAVVAGEGGEGDGEGEKRHWLDERREEYLDGGRGKGGRRKGKRAEGKNTKKKVEEGKFPWSSMRLSSK